MVARVRRDAPGRIRTSDLSLRRRTLYPLSYGRGPTKARRNRRANVRSSGRGDSVDQVSTIACGNAAEAAVLQALTAAGLHVLLPFGGGLSFDLGAVRPDGTVERVQVKCGRVRKGCVEFNTSSTDHGHGQVPYTGRADVIAVHVRSLDRIFVVPVEECPASKGYLRLEAALNNQRRRVRLAEDFSFAAWIKSLGAASAA